VSPDDEGARLDGVFAFYAEYPPARASDVVITKIRRKASFGY
jgi:hypothetical protein